MGIRGLNTFIKKICPEAIINCNIDKYNGKKFGIDASILLYKYRHISNLDENLTNSHIIGFLNRIKYYKNCNIIPVFIFDGMPPEQKKITLKKRQNIKKKIYEKIEILQDINPSSEIEKEEINKEINKLSCQIINVTKNHVLDVKKLLNILEIDYYDAPDEAEKYCVYLQKNNIIDYIITDDTDVFTFGGINILKSTIKNYIVEIDIKLLKEKLQYNNDKFIDFCILSGCDYLPYVPNLAINTVYTLFKKYNNIEDIIKLNKYNFPEEYNNKELSEVRKIFKEFNYEKPPELNNNLINKEKLKEFLENNNIKFSNKLIELF